jgi:enterochelin esterase-like enzyme
MPMTRRSRFLAGFAILLIAAMTACEPLLYNPTPLAVVVTNTPAPTAPPTATPTATPIPPTAVPSASPTATEAPRALPCDETAGEIIDFTDAFSEIARENLRYRVYVPPCYQSELRRLPVLLLFHGLSYREQQWEELGFIAELDRRIADGEAPPMLVVMPWMGQFGQLNTFAEDQVNYENVVLEELLPAIDRDFCTLTNRQFRAIGGISRGGFWAYSIAMRHPDLFARVGGHSAYFSADTISIPPAVNPLELARTLARGDLQSLSMFMDNGISDSAARSQQAMSTRLTARSIPHTYVVNPVGEHDNTYWSAHISEYVDFYTAGWPLTYAALPSCLEPNP